MDIKNDDECIKLIEKLDQGVSPNVVNNIIVYLEKTGNTEHDMTLIKSLNKENMRAKNAFWSIEAQMRFLSEDIKKIKEKLDIQ